MPVIEICLLIIGACFLVCGLMDIRSEPKDVTGYYVAIAGLILASVEIYKLAK